MLKRLKDLSSAVLAMAALGCMGTSAVQAQEVKKQWFAFASGNQPRATEKLVQKDIETRFAAHQAYGPFSWEMRGTTTLTDKIIYDYAIKPAKLIKTDWTYRFDSQAHGSEEALFEALRLTVPKEPACPAPQVSMTQAWTGIPGGGAGAGADGSNVGERGVATVSYHSFNAGSATCEPMTAPRPVQRTREVKCPNTSSTIMKWREDLQMCGMPPALETGTAAMTRRYYSPMIAQQCDAPGNP